MVEEPEFHRAESTVTNQLIRPHARSDRSGVGTGNQVILSGHEVSGGEANESDAVIIEEEELGLEPTESDDSHMEEVRVPKTPHSPRRPTKQEITDHLVSHWPFRSWCRHCVMGRAVSSPHKQRTAEEREFGKSRVPTISFDHCFMGTKEDDESAHSSPFLVMFDDESEAIHCTAVSSKSATPWIIEHVSANIRDLGYDKVKIAVKIDGAKDLQDLRREIAARRTPPTVYLDVPARESQANGAMERAVRTWEGQFRTLKSHLEYEIGIKLPKDHPVLQWCAWWAAEVINRVAVKKHGRTVYEYVTGHRMKTTLTSFGEAVLWRRKRSLGDLNKHDSEWAEGIFLGVASDSIQAIIGTPAGVVKCNDYRVNPDGRWNRKLIEQMNTSFESYINPKESNPDQVVIAADIKDDPTAPQMPDMSVTVRRMRLEPRDFQVHGYTAGCQGCVHVQRGSGSRRPHTEACRARMEECMATTEEGRRRKEREATRKDAELTAELEKEDQRIQADKDADANAQMSRDNIVVEDEQAEAEKTEGEHAVSEDRDYEMATAEDQSKLESGPAQSSDTRVEVEPRAPATPRMRQPHGSSQDSPARKTTRIATSERDALDARVRPGTRMLPDSPSVGARADDSKKSRATMPWEDRTRADTRGIDPGSPDSVDHDDKKMRIDEVGFVQAHDTQNVKLKLNACVANGISHNPTDMKILAKVLMGVDVMEIFSPERVTQVCHEHNLEPGDSIDLRTGYDLSKVSVQRQVEKKFDETEPELIICSPPCTKLSRLQQLNLHMYGE